MAIFWWGGRPALKTNALNPAEVLNPDGGTMRVFHLHGDTYQIVGDSRTEEIADLAAAVRDCAAEKAEWAKLGLNR